MQTKAKIDWDQLLEKAVTEPGTISERTHGSITTASGISF